MNPELSPKSQELIHEWTKEQVSSASKPNFGKIFVTAPNLLEAIGEVDGKKVLEMGCGNGFWLRLLARVGAKCTGIDHAENQIEAAKNWDDPLTTSIEYRVGDVSDQVDMQSQYDLVFFEHVLLEMPERSILDGAIKNASDALKSGGKLVISDMHPFAPSSRPGNMRISEDFSYYDSGAPFEISSTRVDGETIYYKDCHWTLSDIAQAITKAGLVITEIKEPVPSKEDIARYPEQLGYRLKNPMAIMFIARKL